jgi:penicillin-binding protein 1C
VAAILADPSARANTFGLESWLATPYWAAVKTGTSKDMRDNWCAGFSRDYTTVVWVGNAGGDPMHVVSGVSGAAPIWREVMDWLHRGDPDQARPRRASLPPAAPPGVVSVPIRFEPPLEPPRQEWFVSGTERSVIQRSANSDLAAIQYPTEGMVIVLDPDIPLHRQRLPLLLTTPARAGWQWQMDAQPLGQADRRSYWLPQPGAHHLSLLDATGQEKARVRFEVKALRGQGRHK